MTHRVRTDAFRDGDEDDPATFRHEERARLFDWREADRVRRRGASDPKFAKGVPRFLAAVWHIFNEYEIAGYVASRKPARRSLRQQLYLR
jgi:hypothetical protein